MGELRQISCDAATGTRHAEQRVQVFCKEGGRARLHIHIAVQARVESGSAADINRWGLRVLSVGTLDEVFADDA